MASSSFAGPRAPVLRPRLQAERMASHVGDHPYVRTTCTAVLCGRSERHVLTSRQRGGSSCRRRLARTCILRECGMSCEVGGVLGAFFPCTFVASGRSAQGWHLNLMPVPHAATVDTLCTANAGGCVCDGGEPVVGSTGSYSPGVPLQCVELRSTAAVSNVQ